MNVLVCNDNIEPLDSLVSVLREDKTVSSVNVASTGRQVLDALHSSPFDVSISSSNGLDFNRMLQRHIEPGIADKLTRVVATNNSSVPLLVKAHQYGFNNILSLDTEPRNFVPTLQRSIVGEESLANHPTVKALNLAPGALVKSISFKDRHDLNIIELIGVGLPDYEIAEALDIDIQNVRNRIAEIMRINELTNRTQLALLQNNNWRIPDFN